MGNYCLPRYLEQSIEEDDDRNGFCERYCFFDWLVIAGYFVAYLAVGKWAATQIKGSDDFLIAERSLGKLPAALSTAATDLGGPVW